MTHTLETTAISRVVARALRLNEDLVEAIGLGHDTGHTPFGHAGEQALDDALNASFGRRFRHNEQSLRIARRLNLTHEVCDGILTHTGVQEPETLEGKVVRVVDRVAYINHDIDDAIRYGILAESDLPHAEIELLGATGSERIDRLVHDLVETSEEAGDIRQSDEIGEAMLSLRAFMFDRVYLGPQVGPEHRRAHDVLHAIFARLVEDPELPAARRGRSRRADHRLRLRHDRPLRARVRWRARRWRGSRTRACATWSTRRTSSRSSGCGRRCARARARATWAVARFTRSARRASRSTPTSTSTTASAAARAATSSRSSARPRASTSSARSSGWPSGSGSRSSTRRARPLADEAREAPRAALRGARPGGVVLRAPPLGGRRRGAGARVSREPRSRRGDREGVPARPLAGQRPGGEGAREGIHGRGAARRRADEPARQRLLPAAADVPARRRARPGDRLPGAQAARRRPAARASTSTRPRATSSRRAASSTASTSRAPRSRSRTAPSSSRATPT